MSEQALALIKEAKEKRLTRLDIGNCGLTELPEELFELVWLEELVVSDVNVYWGQKINFYVESKNEGKSNKISNISDRIGNLSRLKYLSLRGTKSNKWFIENLKGLMRLKKLTFLDLSYNQIQNVEPLGYLNQLRFLNLNDNDIQNLQPLRSLTNLEYLSLSHNQIENLQPLASLIELRSLYLRHNEIKDLQPLTNLNQLKTLHLSYNNIQAISPLTNLVQLQYLHLSHNKIQKLEPLSSLVQLRELYLRYNRIVNLIPLSGLQHLKFLHLQNNQIKELKLIVDLFKKGLEHNLNDNLLFSPPPEIAEQGNQAIISYFDHPRRPINEAKVIFVGEGASGKTSLIKAVLGEDFDEQENQTHGVIIRKERMEIEGKEITTHFWDFGGQEIMHATHQFFLSKRCVYVLVLDSRKDEKAEYWLKRIRSFGGDSPILVVLNKIDQHPSFRVDERFLQDKYESIQDFFRISCKTRSGIKNFQKKLKQMLWDLPLRQMEIPVKWHAVKQQFEDMTENYISYDQFKERCKEGDITEEYEQNILLEYLNDLGIILHYEKLRLLDTQVLNPLWLTNGVYRIINSKLVSKNNGYFKEEQLNYIINDLRDQPDEQGPLYKYPQNKLLFIANMMRQFELCFRVEDSQYTVPDLLPVQQKAVQFQPGEKVLRFVVHYPNFLPNTVFPRLMVRLHDHIYQKREWRTGMTLYEPLIFKSIANIVVDKDARRLIFSISGERNRDFLTSIRNELKKINDSFTDLKFEELIPLPDQLNGETIYVEYQELLGYENERIKDYFNGKLRKKYSVADLLNGIESPSARLASDELNAFISYSHQDEVYLEKFKVALSPLLRANRIRLWDDGCILPGTPWEEEINNKLARADIFFCLISPDFIASDFCYERELSKAIEAHRKDEKKVVPILIRECLWKDLEISRLQGLPTEWMASPDNDHAWMEVAQGVERVIKDVQRRPFRRMERG